ncbi:MAG TPA: acetoacetate--CoA ligase [Solirubrobacteraceae bacterium]|jgi:acetoacetyl-CoA synthetase|nr:acetoacetate--CoA ligase [Solirubrobacteraceae bacterium]
MSEEPELLWKPSADRVERATLTRFERWLEQERGLSVGSYDELWRWSVDELEAFWASLVSFFDLRFSEGGTVVLGDRSMPGAEWFPGARISYAEHVFRGKDGDDAAIRFASEVRPELAEWTWGRLRSETARVAAGLRALGVAEGDRVVAYMPNIPETVACFLACASIGAVWSSAAPEFGARSVIDRFAQVEPKVLLAVDGYRYGGRDFDRSSLVERIAAELPGLEKVVRLGYLSGEGWEDGFLGEEGSELTFAALPFTHPLWVLYSSGTTGLPKPIVHGQGGILVEQVKMGHLHLDAQAGDRVFWFTTTGWMMWNFLVGVLLTDASIVLFDGNPGHPDLGVLWDLAETAEITTFGTSAAFIASCMKEGLEPRTGRDLSALRAVGSTGSPLSPEGFRWVYDQLGADTWLFSTSGGTDMCTAFVGGVPVLPVYLGELQGRSLGASVEAWDDQGRPLIGEVGELVITEPMPSMPVFFWGDEDGSRLRESYFSMYPGIWRHGDWIKLTSRGTAIIYGRSDSTINRGGVRMGTAEIYRAVLDVDDVVDALVVDLPGNEPAHPDGWMPLFVVLREGSELSDELTAEIRRRIREDCSPRHVPSEIRQISAVPRTLSGKVLEVPVKRILMGTPVDEAASRESLANPEALDFFVELATEGE